MGNGDFSTDLGLRILTPAASIRPVDGHSPNQDAEGKARRRHRPEDEKGEGDETLSEAAGDCSHQLDDLA